MIRNGIIHSVLDHNIAIAVRIKPHTAKIDLIIHSSLFRCDHITSQMNSKNINTILLQTLGHYLVRRSAFPIQFLCSNIESSGIIVRSCYRGETKIAHFKK